MRGKHQVLNWSSQFLTEWGVFNSDDLRFVLQGLLEGYEPADELPDCDSGLQSTESGSQRGVPAVEPPKQALLGPGQDHLLSLDFLFTLLERAPFLRLLDLVPLDLCKLPRLLN